MFIEPEYQETVARENERRCSFSRAQASWGSVISIDIKRLRRFYDRVTPWLVRSGQLLPTSAAYSYSTALLGTKPRPDLPVFRRFVNIVGLC